MGSEQARRNSREWCGLMGQNQSAPKDGDSQKSGGKRRLSLVGYYISDSHHLRINSRLRVCSSLDTILPPPFHHHQHVRRGQYGCQNRRCDRGGSRGGTKGGVRTRRTRSSHHRSRPTLSSTNKFTFLLLLPTILPSRYRRRLLDRGQWAQARKRKCFPSLTTSA